MPEAFASIKVQGLSETVRMLSKVDKGLKKEVSNVLREQAKIIQAQALARSKQTPGVQRKSYRITKGAYTRRVAGTRARVGVQQRSSGKINRNVMGAEFGAKSQAIPRGRTSGKTFYASQARMRKRTFPVWRGGPKVVRGTKGPGWIMLPTLRKRMPQITKELDKEITKLFIQSARRSGLTRV